MHCSAQNWFRQSGMNLFLDILGHNIHKAVLRPDKNDLQFYILNHILHAIIWMDVDPEKQGAWNPVNYLMLLVREEQ